MEILLIIFILLGLTSIFAIISLFYNDGKLVKNKFILTLLTLHILLLGFIGFTALPSNYIFQRSISIIFILVGLIGCFLNFSKKDSTLISRILILLSIIGSSLIIYL